MREPKYLRITFDEKDSRRHDEGTDQVRGLPGNIFNHLNLLTHLMPEVHGAYRYRSAHTNVKPRFHSDHHELLFVLEGTGTYQIGKQKFPVAKNDVLLIKPAELHRYLDGSNFECVSFHFSFDHLEAARKKLAAGVPRNTHDEFIDFLMQHYPKISSISLVEGSQVISKVLHLFQEYQKPGAGSRLLVSLYFLEVLVFLARNYLFARKGATFTTQQMATRDEILVRQLSAYIDEHFAEDINLDDLFRNYYLHPNYCRNIFKKAMGMPVTHYILVRRMNEAKRQIESTADTLQQIASKVGVEDYYYFLRVFKKVHGISPGVLRKDKPL